MFFLNAYTPICLLNFFISFSPSGIGDLEKKIALLFLSTVTLTLFGFLISSNELKLVISEAILTLLSSKDAIRLSIASIFINGSSPCKLTTIS